MNIIQFPRTQDRPFIERHARRMASFRPHKAEEHLQRLLAATGETMRKRGIVEAVISDELRAIECAIRAAIWRVILLEGGTIA